MVKTCKGCWVEKPLGAYYRHKLGKDGLNPRCIECKKQEGLKHRRSREEAPDKAHRHLWEESRSEYLADFKDGTKKCFKCDKTRNIEDFYKRKGSKDGLRGDCRECRCFDSQMWLQNNKEHARATSKQYREKHKDELKRKKNTYTAVHREEAKVRANKWYYENRERALENVRNYREKNKDKTTEWRREWEIKNKDRPDVKLPKMIRKRIRNALKGKAKPGSAVKDLGCTIDELRKHFENLFESGMTWKNHGEWEIDHVTPLSSFNLEDREQFLKACHWTNLQPLWAADNRKKRDKLNWL